jgi:DNA repair protein RecO
VKALVLHKRAYSETDLIIQFFTEHGQILSGFGAGAQRSQKRFPHRFHPAAIYELEWGASHSTQKLSRIKSCDLIEGPHLDANKFEALNRWMIILEWLRLDEAGGHSFDELVLTLKSLGLDELRKYHEFFLNQIMSHGLLPELEKCVVCGGPDADHFSLSEGGLSHIGCSHAIRISTPTLEYLRTYFAEKEAIEEPSLGCLQELDLLSLPYLEQQLDRPLKSRRVLEEIRFKEA